MIPVLLKASPKIVVVGSVAYDYVMKYDKYFANVLLPNSTSHLSVTFPVATQNIRFGGCGGNIAYTLKLLGVDPLLFAVGGKDFDRYFSWLKKNKIATNGISINKDFYTASGYILTDQSEQQITIFHAGAMGSSPELCSLRDFLDDISWVIIAPDDHRRMMRIVKECQLHSIPYIFDPGQQIGQFAPEELRDGISRASIFIVNEYEAELVRKRLKISQKALENLPTNYIETRGEKDCYLHTVEGEFFIPTIKPQCVVDPTGCGDAFRGGLLAGLARGFSLIESCKVGVLAATYSIENMGGQEHFFSMKAFEKRLKRALKN